MNSKKGSSAVFLCLILAALISISLTLVYAAHRQAAISCADGILNLAGDSVLSEYDYYVQKEYGLFLIKGSDASLSARFRNYAAPSFAGMEGISPGRLRVSAGPFNIMDPEPIVKQIADQMKYSIPREAPGNEMEKRVLRHGPTVASLPSRRLPRRSLPARAREIAGGLKEPGLVFKKGTVDFAVDSYILGTFNTDSSSPGKNHFFRNEVEYILAGELSDEGNLRQTDLALKALRFPSNLSHIYSDPAKRAAVIAAAEAVTPGALGALTQAGIASAWAAAESKNDVKLLHEGLRVPLHKDEPSWATDLDGVMDGMREGFMRPAVNKGRKYADHLRILLFFMDENMKISRILDLIQINMRKDHDSRFLIQEYSGGISIDAEAGGKELLYEKIY